MKALEDPINNSGLKIDKVNSFGIDYASRFPYGEINSISRGLGLKLGFDERFYRMWNLYFPIVKEVSDHLH